MTTKVTVKGDSDCQVRILLIGGGGTATGTKYGGGGGGSGFIEYRTLDIVRLSTFQVHVGDTGEASSVIYSVTTVDATHFLANPGQDSYQKGNYYGGNGWSGGGDGCCTGFSGGRNGGDGDGQVEQGRGTGEKLSSFPMKYFTLTPGDRGQPQPVSYQKDKGGGGGGGVIVDGFGPSKIGQGEGYGGGGTYCEGAGCNIEMRKGLPGLILMEIVD